MRLPIDTSAMVFVAGGPATAVTDYESRAPKAGRDGQFLYQLRVAALGDEDSEVINLKVGGEPKGIAKGTPLRVIGLVANPWTLGERHGVSFSADRIEVVGSSASRDLSNSSTK